MLDWKKSRYDRCVTYDLVDTTGCLVYCVVRSYRGGWLILSYLGENGKRYSYAKYGYCPNEGWVLYRHLEEKFRNNISLEEAKAIAELSVL